MPKYIIAGDNGVMQYKEGDKQLYYVNPSLDKYVGYKQKATVWTDRKKAAYAIRKSKAFRKKRGYEIGHYWIIELDRAR